MNIRQMEYFIAVAELLNFTRAAERCHISQTAITQQIRSLETSIGVPLFERNSHHVRLTAAGNAYLIEARAILNHCQEARRIARLASEGANGELTIGYISGYGQSDFGELLRIFHQSCPGIKINLIRGNLSILMEHLANRQCDLVFAVASFSSEKTNLHHQYLRSYPIMAAIPAGHPLAKHNSITYQDLKNEPLILMQPADRPRDQMEESLLIFQRGGYLPDITAVEGDPETLLLMIASGMGISLLPEYIIRSYHVAKNVKILPLLNRDGITETVDFEVTWLESNTNPAIERLLSVIKVVDL